MRVIDADYEMTGGYNYTYWGRFDNGEYFVFGMNTFQKLDADYGITFTEEFFKETGGDTYDWEKEHQIGDYIEYPKCSKEVDECIRETFKILKQKYPNNSLLDSLMDSEINTNDLMLYEIRKFMTNTLGKAISDDYIDYIINEILNDVIDNVNATADEEYSDDDVRLAIGRVLMDRLGIEK